MHNTYLLKREEENNVVVLMSMILNRSDSTKCVSQKHFYFMSIITFSHIFPSYFYILPTGNFA